MLSDEQLKIIKAKTQNVPMLYLWQVLSAVNEALQQVAVGSIHSELITAEDYD